MAAAPMIMMGLGAAMSAVGAIRQGQAAEAAGEYNARVNENNAVMARQQAVEEARRQGVAAAKQMGSIQAGLGASGLTGGTAMDIMAESAANAELDAMTIRHGGQVRATAYGNDAALSRNTGYWANQAGYVGAASHVLSGAGTALYYGTGSAEKSNTIKGDSQQGTF